jgi:hypothetical protein
MIPAENFAAGGASAAQFIGFFRPPFAVGGGSQQDGERFFTNPFRTDEERRWGKASLSQQGGQFLVALEIGESRGG